MSMRPEETLIPFVGMLIPIVAIVMGVGLGMLALYLTHKRREMYHKERLAAIEKGVELPPEAFFEGQLAAKSPRVYLLRGLVWLFVGVATVVFMFALSKTIPGEGPPQGVAFMGLIPVAIGLAYLIFYFIEGKKMKEEKETKKV